MNPRFKAYYIYLWWVHQHWYTLGFAQILRALSCTLAKGFIILGSSCINRFLCEWRFFALLMHQGVEKNVESCISHIILYILHQTKIPSFTNKEIVVTKMLELILCLPFTLLLPYNLAHNFFDIRWGVWGTREDFANHLCIILWYKSHLQPYSGLLCNHYQSSPIPRHISLANIICTPNSMFKSTILDHWDH